MKRIKLTPAARKCIDAFDKAAQTYGYSSDQGSAAEAAEDRLTYEKAKRRLELLVSRLQGPRYPTSTTEWEYSQYRASLRRNGETFALMTRDGKNSLNAKEQATLLEALNQPRPVPLGKED